jgi:putative endonuclease
MQKHSAFFIMFYTYVLLSQKDNKYYIGQTNDVKARFLRHQKGMVKSTKNRRPLNLLFFESFESRAEAMKHEKFLKSGAGHNYIKQKLEGTTRNTGYG